MPDFSQLDTPRLFAIAQRVVSHETVTSAEEFAATIKQAADIAIQAGLYIITGEKARDLGDIKLINRVLEEYNA